MTGIIKKILYENEDNGFCIATLVIINAEAGELPENFNESSISIKGYFPCREDMEINISGKLAGQEVVSNSFIIKTICNLATEGDLRGDNGNAYLAKNFERETIVAYQ